MSFRLPTISSNNRKRGSTQRSSTREEIDSKLVKNCRKHGMVRYFNNRCPKCYRERLTKYSSKNRRRNRNNYNLPNNSNDYTLPSLTNSNNQESFSEENVSENEQSLDRIVEEVQDLEDSPESEENPETNGLVYNNNNNINIRRLNINNLNVNRNLNERLPNIRNLENPSNRLFSYVNPMLLASSRSHRSYVMSNPVDRTYLDSYWDESEDNKVTNELLESKSNVFNVSNSDSKCIICQDDFSKNNKARILECMHYYHKDCIDKWFENKDTCPICRTSILN
jgi:hypothetical protein